MKRMILAALTVAMTLPAAINTQAQDDVYYSRKNSRKAAYELTHTDVWETKANEDWDLDAYNRRGKSVESASASDNEVQLHPLTYNVSDSIAPVPDTIFVVEKYYYSDRIRRFHNPFFGRYLWDPWYDIAFYDPFYWDYCYWDPWWYCTPSFGFYSGWWWGSSIYWNPGYYSGWYGGYYHPFYHSTPHHYLPGQHYAHNGSHHGHYTNSVGGRFTNHGLGNRRTGNLAHTNTARPQGATGHGVGIRGGNAAGARPSGVSRKSNMYGGASTSRTERGANGYNNNNSGSRRADIGIRQDATGNSTGRGSYNNGRSSTMGGHSSGTRYGNRGGSYSGGSRSSNSSRSSYGGSSSSSSSSSTRSSGGGYSSGGSYGGGGGHSGGGGYSGGGGGGSHSGGGGSHGGGGGRR